MLAPMMAGGHLGETPVVDGEICGICALEVKNAILGTRLTQHHGEMAEYARLHAKEARRNGSAIPPPADTV